MRDPNEKVRVGQIVSVRVLEVDVARKRISLSMKSRAEPGEGQPARERDRPDAGRRTQPAPKSAPASTGSLGAALADAFDRFAPTLTRYAWALAGSKQDVEELVQDTFLTLWQKSGELDLATSALLPWLRTAAPHPVDAAAVPASSSA